MTGSGHRRRSLTAPGIVLGAVGFAVGLMAALMLGLGRSGTVAEAADFSGLVDTLGRPASRLPLAQHYKLVAYGYTACPDACPATLTRLHAILSVTDPSLQRIIPLFVTLDPAHDAPDLLAQYIRHFDQRVIGLTGSSDAVQHSAATLHALPAESAQQVTPDGRPNHAVALYLLGPDNRLLKAYSLQDPTPLVAGDIHRRLRDGGA